MKKLPIEVFSDWAESGKDHGMEKNHLESVNNMLDFATKGLKKFRTIDAGCGNGWVVRKLAQLPNCSHALGVDGSQKMIAKAQSIDSQNDYICSDLSRWKPEKKVDLVHSMEVFYYLERPQALIQNIYSNWLNERGRLIIGLDFYFENTVSHSWPEECGVSIMKLFPEKKWVRFFGSAGFKNIQSWRVGAKENWKGTLVVTGTKF